MPGRIGWVRRHDGLIRPYLRAPSRVMWVFLLGLFCWLWCPLFVGAQGADSSGAVVYESLDVEYAFSDTLTFSIEASSAQTIEDVALFFGRQGERVVRRIYPAFEPSDDLSVSHVEILETGHYAPGTSIEYWWELTVTDASYRSPTQTFLYEDDRFAWEIVVGERIDLHGYGDDGDWERNGEILAAADAAVARLEQEIGVAVPERPQVYVYNTDSDMALALTTRSDAYDDRILTLGVALDERTLIVLGSHRDVLPTVAHEMSHIVVGLATDNPYTRLPRWLDEGLAMHAEGGLPRENQRALDRAIADDALHSIRTLTSYSGLAEEVDLFYGEASSIVDFMIDTYGRDTMRKLLAQFASGKRQADAVQTALGVTLDELDLLWRQSLGLGPRSQVDVDSSLGVEPEGDQRDICVGPLGFMALPLVGLALGRRFRHGEIGNA